MHTKMIICLNIGWLDNFVYISLNSLSSHTDSPLLDTYISICMVRVKASRKNSFVQIYIYAQCRENESTVSQKHYYTHRKIH